MSGIAAIATYSCELIREVKMERRETDPYPWTWEIPAACAVGLIIVAAAVIQIGRSLSYVLAGQGWVWPEPNQLLTSLPPLLAGRTNAGLAPTSPAVSVGLVVTTVVCSELLAFALVGVLAWRFMIHIGPSSRPGMASAGQANRLLGRSRLRRARRILRPDLFAHPDQ